MAKSKTPKGGMLIGSQVFEISDHASAHPVWVDVITDARDIGGIVRLSLGNFAGEGQAEASIMVTTRLRFTMSTAANLRNILDGFIQGETKAKKAAN